MKIGIIGYNLFAIGGTARSNINLMTELVRNNEVVYYFNYAYFTQKDIKKFINQHSLFEKVNFNSVINLFNRQHLPDDIDYLIITREDLFPLSKLLRELFPNAELIGEIHTPLPLLPQQLDGLADLSCVRVANQRIQRQFAQKYHYSNIFVQTVNAGHIHWNIKETKESTTNNFVISSRFAENQKDIMYALKLFNELHKRGAKQYHLFLKGTGPDKWKYKKYIKEHNLTQMISFTKQLPSNFVYLSTSRFETFGYSIMEAIANHHPVLAYVGDDKSIEQIYSAFPSITWFTKQNINDDIQKLVKISKFKITKEIYQEDLAEFNKLTCNKNYVQALFRHFSQFNKVQSTVCLSSEGLDNLKSQIEQKLGKMNPNIFKKIYYCLRKIPIFDQIFKLIH